MIQRPYFILILALAHTYTIHTCIYTIYILILDFFYTRILGTSLLHYTLIKNIYDPTSYFTLALFQSYCLHDIELLRISHV